MRGLILLFGDEPSPQTLQDEAAKAKLIVAADGALGYALKAGVTPDLVIGDFDSFQGALPAGEYEIIALPPEKDETDGQAAFTAAVKRGCREIVLLGSLGGRPDHALGHISLLRRAARMGIDARMIEGDSMLFCALPGIACVQGTPGDTVSIWPCAGDIRIRCTSGLKYPVRGGILPSDNTFGISNELTESKALIDIVDGEAIFIHIHKRHSSTL